MIELEEGELMEQLTKREAGKFVYGEEKYERPEFKFVELTIDELTDYKAVYVDRSIEEPVGELLEGAEFDRILARLVGGDEGEGEQWEVAEMYITEFALHVDMGQNYFEELLERWTGMRAEISGDVYLKPDRTWRGRGQA